jgi:hypothetical protein
VQLLAIEGVKWRYLGELSVRRLEASQEIRWSL